MSDVLRALEETLEARKNADPDSSYVASLYAKGLNKILEKIGEEATEVIIAAKDCNGSDQTREALVSEVADLWFHSMLALSQLGYSHEEVLDVLASRFGQSGLAEKAARSGHNDSTGS